MENEKEINFIEKGEQISKNVFKTDYKGQSLFNNTNFIKWQKEMFEEYGYNSKLFECKKCNIYYYVNCDKYPFYQGKCPLCSTIKCYYCSRYSRGSNGDCCLPRRLQCMFKQDAYQFIKPIGENNSDTFSRYKEVCIPFFIPFFGFWCFCLHLHSSLYYKLCKKNAKSSDDGYIPIYESSDFLCLIICINALVCIILSIPFHFLFFLFIIFLFLLSPIKQYYLRYFSGVLFGKF